MRCSGGTKSAPPSDVTRATKLTMALLAMPGFHDGNTGSSGCANAVPLRPAAAGNAITLRRVSIGFHLVAATAWLRKMSAYQHAKERRDGRLSFSCRYLVLSRPRR